MGDRALDRRAMLKRLWAGAKLVVSGGLAFVGIELLRRGIGEAVAAPAAQAPVRPPGALEEDSFRERCTRCFLCGEVCPVGAIRFPFRVTGAQVHMKPPRGVNASQDTPQVAPEWHADGTPMILPWEKGCALCMRCGEACPTGALRPVAAEREAVAEQVRMGVARIDRKICLPWTRRSWCGACHTACPYRNEAITVDYQNRPTVHAEHCVGCGICVEVCPIRYKAIAVVPPFEPDLGRVRSE